MPLNHPTPRLTRCYLNPGTVVDTVATWLINGGAPATLEVLACTWSQDAAAQSRRLIQASKETLEDLHVMCFDPTQMPTRPLYLVDFPYLARITVSGSDTQRFADLFTALLASGPAALRVLLLDLVPNNAVPTPTNWAPLDDVLTPARFPALEQYDQMSIHQLPVELFVKIMSGLQIRDILSITRTCAYFRHISLKHRQIWIHAEDSGIIPLPSGEGLATVELGLLPTLAYRATSIQEKWNAPVLVPRRTVEPSTIYSLQTWGRWGDSIHPLPSILRLLPGARTFLIGNEDGLCLYDLTGNNEQRLDFFGKVKSIDWIASDNCTVLGLLLEGGPRGRYAMYVFFRLQDHCIFLSREA
ncbi:hypothetical protein C8R46DRAFT_1224216 [Mycena filopes]|nr:hypothetical protein C8R46DRAFT_1224216 [Mycena filopes]